MSIHHTQISDGSQGREGVFSIYKAAGETLHSLVERFRREQGFVDTVPITYAGRLDPMASGVVLLLVGEMCKKKDTFLGRDKTYVFEVLLGLSTDTFDMLGYITGSGTGMPAEEEILNVASIVSKETEFSYPPFSSKPVDSIPLFMYAKAGTVPEVLPTMKGEVKRLEIKSVRSESLRSLVRKSVKIIEIVKGDFRQSEILDGWKIFLETHPEQKYFVATCEATVTSGVYIRTLAVRMGELLGLPSLAYSIERMSVGEHEVKK